jgi:predicted RNase H-like nuclease
MVAPTQQRRAPRGCANPLGGRSRRRRGHLGADLVAGINGCRAGWLVVTVAADPGADDLTIDCVANLDAVVADLDAGRLAAAAVDIPIGLPGSGPRRCDVEARKRIVPRHNSVFPAPARGVLGSTSFREALFRSREIGGKGISKQTFAILPKIAAVDAMMTPERQRHMVEMHPEVSFRVLADRPLGHHKASTAGREERLAALRSVFPAIELQSVVDLDGVAPDDVLDAFVAAWTARRWLARDCEEIGGDLDERGLRMEMIA